MLNSPSRVRDHDRHGGGANLPEEVFGQRYKALLELGRSSAGKLYLAADATGGPHVVVKAAADAELLLHEAEVLSALRHPNLVKLKERYDTASPPFLVLEPVDGIDFEAFLQARGGTLDEPSLGYLLLQLADTIAFVHARSFLHRDLKPGNVLLRPDNSPVIVDFGAALPFEDTGTARPWSFVTEGYAAPEQYFADQAEGPWTDIYGLGALAYRALTGHAPPPALIRAGGAPGEPLAANGAKAQALRKAIDWALEPDAADRPQTVAAWRDSLATALDQAREEIWQARASKHAASDLDDYPPTVRVARIATRQPGHKPADTAAGSAAARPRRAARVLPIVLFLCVVLAGLAAAGVYGWPLYERYIKTEWLVDAGGGGDAASISDALARAGDGAIIRVGPGTYAESLRIERPVTLIALEGATPVVAPESGPCILATSPEGTIAGLELRTAAAGGPAEAPPVCVILSAGAVHLEDNRILGETAPAILIRDGADPVVRGNSLEGGGLVVAAGGRGTITENSIAAGGGSLVVRGGAEPSLGDNDIEGGVVFAEGASGSFIGNRLRPIDSSGIQVTTGANPRIVDNTIEGAKEAGIFVYNGGAGRFEGNTIADSGLSGVTVAGDGNPAFVGNTIRGSAEHGILVVEGGRARLEGNQIIGSEGHGIALGEGSEVELVDNRLEDNDEPQLLDAR